MTKSVLINFRVTPELREELHRLVREAQEKAKEDYERYTLNLTGLIYYALHETYATEVIREQLNPRGLNNWKWRKTTELFHVLKRKDTPAGTEVKTLPVRTRKVKTPRPREKDWTSTDARHLKKCNRNRAP